MSTHLMLKLFSKRLASRPWSINEFAVLVALAYHEGYAWPSYKALAHELGTSDHVVIRIIKRLEDLGLVKVSRGRGRGHVNRYQVTLERLLKGDSESPIEAAGKGDSAAPFAAAENVTDTPGKRDSIHVGKRDSIHVKNVTESTHLLKKELEKEVRERTAAPAAPSVSLEKAIDTAEQLLREQHVSSEIDFMGRVTAALVSPSDTPTAEDRKRIRQACKMSWTRARNARTGTR